LSTNERVNFISRAWHDFFFSPGTLFFYQECAYVSVRVGWRVYVRVCECLCVDLCACVCSCVCARVCVYAMIVYMCVYTQSPLCIRNESFLEACLHTFCIHCVFTHCLYDICTRIVYARTPFCVWQFLVFWRGLCVRIWVW